ncbi:MULTISPECIES: TonB-dependent siderophore receptor [unclassified Rhizobium]|uniref:TonB-dependent siderophore receptor n=1 Tax=unclassified Rhizobium TaxID=2613769 RepID=UPI001ADA71A8|nr:MULTISPECIES: TonB-dependent siderophore receptor [unclassified Rhizobium]MBO9100693.1 TonB-dependent siderophore receptor [Rhizobium sp. L58/93]MBO9135946.1 TonB-dependent siderophore receptor [Rhizobium sp. B209b/85]MBO9171257.1 TonB-dependent siderophore receptor [Rhizobium sp. L245/93]MBO9187124.1 TonB-dependent siderophore receptor [Rhizobium sp. E27B/91]QXZ88094.1 TonB-dependent siderophore receptor [Rhizobium sp. K1/93]
MTYLTKGISFKARLAVGVAMASLALVTSATAEETQPTELKPLVVQGGQGGKAGATDTGSDTTGRDPVKGYVAKTTTAGSKADIPIKDLPQSVSVVGQQEMQDRGITNKVDEALRYTPGVNTQPFGNDGDTDWFYIRGFDATQTGVFLDGLTLFSYGFGGFQIDPFSLERIEVLKGASSVTYGGTNPGGIVNMVRKEPTDQPLYYTEIGINNNGNAYAGFDFSDKLSADGVWSYRLTGKVAGGDQYSDFTHDLRGFVMPQITISPDESTKFSVYAYVSGLDEVHSGNGFFPYVGTVVDAPFGKIDRKAFYGEPSIDKETYSQEMVGYSVEHEFDGGWKLSQNLRYGHLKKDEEGPYLNGYVGGDPNAAGYSDPSYELARIGFTEHSKADSFSVDNNAQREFDLGGISHNFLIGTDYSLYRLDNVQACCGSNPISATDPVYNSTQGANFVYLDQVMTQQQLGVYAQDQMKFGDGWLVTLNGRYDFVDENVDSRISTDSGSNSKSPSGRAGLAYDFGNGITPYVSVGTFFNPLIGTTATGAGLVPEEGEQYEAGIKYQPTFMDALFTASVFNINRKNMALTDPATFLQYQLGEVRSRGVELEGKVNLDQNWKLLGSYSYTDLEVTKNLDTSIVGNSPYLVPNSTASLWLDYAVTDGALEGVSLGAGMRYQGKSWADAANTLRVPSATVFDAAVRYEKNGWGAALSVANVFDKEYVSGCAGVNTCGYGDARTFTLKLSKKW